MSVPVPVDSVDRSISVIDTRDTPDCFTTTGRTICGSTRLIDLQERAPDGVQADLTIRGSGFGQTLVLVERPAYERCANCASQS